MHIWEGWTVGDFVERFTPELDHIMSGRSWRRPFTTKQELATWCRENQPYYKKHIPGVVAYFARRYRLRWSNRRWFTTIAFMLRVYIPRTGGGFSAGCFVLLVSTCVKQRLRVTRDASIRRTFASRKQLSVIWHSVFEVTARYVCGSSHMTCTRSILSGISMSMESGSIDSCLSLWLFKPHISTCGNMWIRTSSGRERSYYFSVKMCWIFPGVIFKAVSLVTHYYCALKISERDYWLYILNLVVFCEKTRN